MKTFVPTAALLIGAFVLNHPARSATSPTFSRDVWPILQQRCVGCHQDGEIGPMALTSYQQVRPWAAAIREAVRSRSMPPWHAREGATSFQNDRSLTAKEIDTITAWVESGSNEGSPVKPYAPPSRNTNWKLGKPDITIQVPGFAVPKSGPLPYSFLIVPLHLDHDVWVRAAEFHIEQRAVIHHFNAFVRPPNSSYLAGFPAQKIFVPTLAERGKRRDGEKVFDRRELLLGYEPGYEAHQWLTDGAKLIRAGSDVIFELHYNPNGKEVVDHSELALYFADAAPAKRILAIDTLRDLDLLIPPGDRDYHSKATMTLAAPAQLLSVQPHMHLRGKSMEVRAFYPDGTSGIVVNVPKYDFQWQTTYVFTTPLDLPAGTRLESVAGFDNSANNRFNPDPASSVRWGDQTTDEMHIAFLELVIPANTDVETLLKERPRMVTPPPVTASVPHQ